MTAALLGLRLALTPSSRVRTLLGVLATALGAVALLVVAAIARGQLGTESSSTSSSEKARVVLVVVVAVALPLIVLIATVGRLSASLRDRRLANLRLIGLTPGQTRLVAACEAGSAAVVGTALGWLVFVAARSAALEPVQRPDAVDVLVIVLAIPLLVVALAVLPQRRTAAAALATARRADRRPPSLLRAGPVLVGIAMCLYVISRGHQEQYPDWLVGMILGGIAVTGVGVILVVPVFVRIVARLMSRFSRGATATVTARRLEAQPSGVIRVVAALLIGLFLATGARFVVTAFESTSQYVTAARDVEESQHMLVQSPLRQSARVAERATAVEGVESALTLPTLSTKGCRFCGLTAVVATCEQLEAIAPELTGCRAGEPMWLEHGSATHLPTVYRYLRRSDTIDWYAGKKPSTGERAATTPVAMVEMDEAPSHQFSYDLMSPVEADVILPPAAVGELPADTTTDVLVIGVPGRTLFDDLSAEGLHPYTMPDYEYYDFVGGLRALVISIAAFILTVGLLAFAVAAVDRAVERRKELVGLQLVGLPRGLLRRAQWLEALVPIGLGSALAVVLGALAGSTYLSLDESAGMPWQSTGVILLAASLGSVVVASLTVVASAQPIRADQIRRE